MLHLLVDSAVIGSLFKKMSFLLKNLSVNRKNTNFARCFEYRHMKTTI